jgi:dTDP-4-amino-4,6-dideoxygalactose transaminase
MTAPLALFGRAPALDNARHVRWPVIDAADRQAVLAVLDRGVFSGPFAPEVRALEQEFAEYVGARYALSTNSGTSALHIALAAAGVGPGDEVITSAYSFVATAQAVLHQQAIPVFVDIEPHTCGIDPERIERAITPRTRALLPVHIHGMPCQIDEVVAIGHKHGIPVIEDACQAHGAIKRGRKMGAIGDAAAFSLQSSKNLPCGEGGLFVTSDPELYHRANRVRMFGEDMQAMEEVAWDADRPLDAKRAYDSVTVGWMYRTTEMSAALARAQLRKLDRSNEQARRNARRLSAALGQLPGVIPPHVPEDCAESVHKFRVRLDPSALHISEPPKRVRDAMITALRAEGLEVVMWQSQPVPGQRLFREKIGYGGGVPWDRARPVDYELSQFPETVRLLDSSLVLFSQSCPIFPQTEELIDIYAETFARVWSHLGEVLAGT